METERRRAGAGTEDTVKREYRKWWSPALGRDMELLVFGERILVLLCGSGGVLAEAQAFLGVFSFAVVVIWLMNTLAAILRGTGNMRLPSATVFTSAVCQIGIGGALSLGLAGLPRLGIRGIAIGQLAAYLTGVAVMAWPAASVLRSSGGGGGERTGRGGVLRDGLRAGGEHGIALTRISLVLTSPPTTTQARHVPALDGVRGLAILLVLWHHVYMQPANGLLGGLYQLNHAAWVGVDLFFVLSGFLITGILYDSLGRDDFFRRFCKRRSLRIFPLYYGVLLALLALSLPLGLQWPWRGRLLVPYTQNAGLR